MKSLFPKKSRYLQQVKLIFLDLLFVYKNFLHFCVSKIIISFVSITVGLIFFLPIFLFALIVMLIDPISWYQILSFVWSWTDITVELIGELAMHPYWLIIAGFLIISAFVAFLLASSFNLFLLSRLALWYVKRKPVSYKKSFMFSVKHILRHVSIVALMFIYLLGPIIIAVWCIFFLYLFLSANYISQKGFEALSIILALVFAISILYILFRIMFWYICFADCKKKKNFHTARWYVFDSIKLTSGTSILKFIPVLLVYIIFTAPFNIIDTSLSRNLSEAKDAYTYRILDIQKVDEKEKAYFDYIMKEYSQLDTDSISDRIRILSVLSLVYGVMYYFILGGTFIVLLTSFYKRILLKA